METIKPTLTPFQNTMYKLALIVFFSWAMFSNQQVNAGSFVFAGASNGINLITHPSGYTGTGGTLDVKVCLVPGTANETIMATSVQNSIAYWNKRQPTTSNLRPLLPVGKIDFESIFVHELGHCIGLAHPNLATESGVPASSRNYTKSTKGIDNAFGLNAGNDNIIGSEDDIRGDDKNLHWFRQDNNNPFSIQAVIDASTYARDLNFIPTDDEFVANADRNVSVLFETPNSEAIMQQGAFSGEIQRTLIHDDIATLRFAMSGLDEIANTQDDYAVNLIYGGISNATDCNINVDFDDSKTGLATCSINGRFLPSNTSHAGITHANIYFNTGINWFFNNTSPCQESMTLTTDKWSMFSLPCQMGISTSNTVEAILGDALNPADYSFRWVVYQYFPVTDIYHRLALTDTLHEGVGYWVITLDSDITITIKGEYPSTVDLALDADSNGKWNLVGTPFRHNTTWANAQVIDTNGEVLSLNETDPTLPSSPLRACDITPIDSSCVVASTAFRWVASTQTYDKLTLSSGDLSAFDGIWVFAAKPGVALRIPMPNNERITQ